MNFSRSLSAVLIGAAVAIVQPQFAVALTPVEVKAITKEFTIRIGGDGSGTGVIFDHKGDTYFVLTNRHVVSNDGRYEIQTNDGSVYPVYRSQELPGLDLAVLQFTSNKNYRTANFGNSDQITEKMTVYVAGWPADLLPGISERSYGFTVGSILRREPRPDQGYALVYDNEALPGMSGGPVLDENGRVVGINGRAEANINPKNSQAWYNQAEVLRELKRNEEAIASYDRAIQVNNEWGQSTLADAYVRRGDIRYEQEDYARALADYNEVIRLKPKNIAVVYAVRGVVNQRLGNNQAALADFNSANRIDPNNAVVFTERGFAYHLQGDYQRALATYQKAIALDAKLLPAVNNIGFVKYELGDMEGAIRQFQAAIAINNKSAEPQLALAVALYAKGEREQGLTMAEAALRLDNRYADVKFLKKNLWGDRILADTQKLLQNPRMRSLSSGR